MRMEFVLALQAVEDWVITAYNNGVKKFNLDCNPESLTVSVVRSK